MILGIDKYLAPQRNFMKQSGIKTKILLSALVFLIALLTYLLACPEWFFDGEDWILILKGAQCTGLRDFFGYFIHGKVNHLAAELITDNTDVLTNIAANDSFFTVYYRPLLLAFHALGYYLFSIYAYPYFIFILLLHAANSAVLFLLLSTLVQPTIAFLCSLFFTFHPILYGWFGRIDTMQHMMNVFIMLVLVIVLKKYLVTRTLKLYLLSCLLLFLSLLTRETLIILPAILLLWSFPLSHYEPYEYLKKLSLKLLFISGFCAVIFLYFLAKSVAYPLVFTTSASPLSNSSAFSLTQCFTGWIMFLYNFFWLQWFPWTTYEFFRQLELLTIYKLIKIIIILCIATLFTTNTKKKYIVLAVVSAFILYWPPILFIARGGIRLFYESLPFMILACAYLLNNSILMSTRFFKYVFYTLFALIISINGYAIIRGMHTMMVFPKKFTLAVQQVQQENSPHPMVILSTRGPFYACGMIQAIELYCGKRVRPSYFVDSIVVHLHDRSAEIDQLVHVQKQHDSIRLISQQSEKIWFQIADQQELEQSLGINVKINQTEQKNNITDLSLIFEKNFYHSDLRVAFWLFEQERFVLLGER